MTTAEIASIDESVATTRVDVDIVVPVHNEQTALAPSVHRLHQFLQREFPLSWRITIADNASTDDTWVIAQRLAATLPGVTAAHLDAKGRGRALRAVWSQSDSAVVAYMDVDLSTDLKALLPLVAPLVSGHSDVAIGTRLGRGARVVRGPKREFISRGYNLLLRTTLRTRFTDAQCGFKAVRTDLARQLLPLVEDTGWFFDTELLFLAQRSGLRIAEVPVDWVDDPDSRVDIVATAAADLRGVLRLGRGVVTGSLSVATLRRQVGRHPEPVEGVEPGLVRQLVRFAAVGALSTLAYLLLFVLLRGDLGAQPANFLALLVTAVGNTAVNRRFTFGVRDNRHRYRHHVAGLAAFGLGLGLTSGGLAVLHAVTEPGRALELTVLVLANLAATLLRFVVLRTVVSPRPAAREPGAATPSSPRGNR